jgi:hypothetical protein
MNGDSEDLPPMSRPQATTAAAMVNRPTAAGSESRRPCSGPRRKPWRRFATAGGNCCQDFAMERCGAFQRRGRGLACPRDAGGVKSPGEDVR